MKNRHEAAETPEQIIEHISRLMAEAEAMLAGPVSGEMNGKLSMLKERIGDARERAGVLYSRARSGVIAGAKYTDNTIREYPYYSIGVALGVGLLVGALLRRPKE